MTDSFKFDDQNSATNGGQLALASGIVVSCRVRLARNIADFPFLDVCSQDQRAEIETTVRATIKRDQSLSQLTIVDCQQLQMMELQFLAELQAVIGLGDRNVNAVEFADQEWSETKPLTPQDSPSETSLASDKKQSATARSVHSNLESNAVAKGVTDWGAAAASLSGNSLILNEEDHLRIQVTRDGLDLENAWSEANKLDDQIEKQLNFAFSPQFGYLTACPANVGTGMRVSVVLHLPALVASGGIHEVLRGLARPNVVGRELFGDPAGGDFYRFSNQATLGHAETALVEQVATMIPTVVAAEQAARVQWLASSRDELLREVASSLKKLKRHDLEDHSDPNQFALTRLLSRVRLGLELRLLDHSQTAPVVAKFELVQLQERLRVAIATEDYRRASQLRDRIQFLSGDSA